MVVFFTAFLGDHFSYAALNEVDVPIPVEGKCYSYVGQCADREYE